MEDRAIASHGLDKGMPAKLAGARPQQNIWEDVGRFCSLGGNPIETKPELTSANNCSITDYNRGVYK